MRTLLTGLFLLILTNTLLAQSGWDVYLAQWEQGLGSVTLNMDLIHSSPKPELPFIVITGIKYKKCRPDGLPDNEAFDLLYEVSDSVERLVAKQTTKEFVGTFTYQCERLDYIYVKDTVGLRPKLIKLYNSKFTGSTYYISIKKDEEWKAYREFLYPNEETQEHMANQRVIEELLKEGDKLESPRKVDHWLYFKSKIARLDFTKQIKKDGYEIEDSQEVNGNEYPYAIRISRTDRVNPSSINAQTLGLKKIAMQFGGKYDGWETFVVK